MFPHDWGKPVTRGVGRVKKTSSWVLPAKGDVVRTDKEWGAKFMVGREFLRSAPSGKVQGERFSSGASQKRVGTYKAWNHAGTGEGVTRKPHHPVARQKGKVKAV